MSGSITRRISTWQEVRHAQALGYASLGSAGLVLGFVIGRPLWATIPGVVIALVWLLVLRLWRPQLAKVPSPKPRPRWVYVAAGPALYGCGAAVVVFVAWLVGRHSNYSGLGTIAASVMSAFALGTAAFFEMVRQKT